MPVQPVSVNEADLRAYLESLDPATLDTLHQKYRPSSAAAVRLYPPKYHDAQKKFWDSQAKFRGAFSGVGGGKTKCGVYEALSQPPSLGTIAAPSYRILMDSTLRTFLEVAQAHDVLQKFRKDDTVGGTIAYLKNGSEVMFRSAEDPNAMRGPNLGWFWLDEAPYMDASAWLVMIGRLREAPGRAWVTGTPDGYNWAFDTFPQNTDPNYWWISWPTRDNIFLPEGFVSSLEMQYDDYWRAQDVEGQFVAKSSHAVFDVEYLHAILPDLKEPIERWKEGTNGLSGTLDLWEMPEKGVRYVIGGDVAEGLRKEKSDLSDGFVIRCDTLKQVGHYYGKPDPKSFALDLFNISEWFNGAETGVENNSVGLVVISYLEDLGCNLWYNDLEDANYLREPDRDQRAGMRTTARSKGMVDGELRAAIVDTAQGRHSIKLQSKITVEQCIHYVHQPNGGRGGEGRWHDDAVRSAAICWYIAKEYRVVKSQEYYREIMEENLVTYGGYWKR